MGNDKIYIHYGDFIFHPEAIGSDHNDAWRNKPNYALWASPINAKFGWRDFCEGEDFRTDTLDEWFTFILKPWAKVFYVDSLEKERDIPVQYVEHWTSFDRKVYDFEMLKEIGYDAIEVNISKCPELYSAMYSWDCDSIAIFNPEAVEVIFSKNMQAV